MFGFIEEPAGIPDIRKAFRTAMPLHNAAAMPLERERERERKREREKEKEREREERERE